MTVCAVVKPGPGAGTWSHPPFEASLAGGWSGCRGLLLAGPVRSGQHPCAVVVVQTAAGCDVVTVQRALGHRSATVTLATYAHLWPTAEDRTRQAAAAMVGEVLRLADYARTTGTGGHADLR